MDENRLFILGFIWCVINYLYVNSCRQEDNALQKALAKISYSPDEDIHIPSMSRNTRSALGLGIAFMGIVIGFISMRRTLAIQATVANEAAPARPSENAVNQIPPSSSFFQANNSSRDKVTPEQNSMEEPKTNSPK